MEIGLSATEGAELHGLLAEAAGDIVVKLDANGFIQHASPNIKAMGLELSQLLFLPHIADLACANYVDGLRFFVAASMSSDAPEGPFEFPIAIPGETGLADQGKWHSLSLRPVLNDDGTACGALGLLRSIEHRRMLEGELYASATTDHLTGLCNGKVFAAKLRRAKKSDEGGALALFELDRFRAIFMQYGQSAAEEVLWAFAQFLEAMSQPDYDLAHLDGGRFAVCLPGLSSEDARVWCEDVLETFAALAIGATPGEPRLSASVGLTTLSSSVNEAFKQAELALVMARASGGMRVGVSGDARGPIVFRERPMVGELGVSFAAR